MLSLANLYFNGLQVCAKFACSLKAEILI